MAVLGALAALWWALAMASLSLSCLAALLHPHLSGPTTEVLPPVTAIVPVKEWNAHLEDDQASLLAQDYPRLEILVTAAEDDSPALAAARSVLARFPAMTSRILKSDIAKAASPKLNNLWRAIGEAGHDLILTKDSNIRLEAGDLKAMARRHAPGIGLVGMIPILRQPQSPSAWIEAAFVNGCYGRLLMLASVLGIGANPGKIMLFSRAALDQVGGIESLAWAIGEDEAITQAFARHGLRTVLCARTCSQIAGPRLPREVWQRQLRWMMIWRLQKPAIFLGSIFAAALPAILAAGVAAPLAGLAPWAGALATLGLWFGLESLLCLLKGWPWSLWSLPAFAGREIMALAVWLSALTTRDVMWAGARHRAAPRESRET